jgi:hypothetical protein
MPGPAAPLAFADLVAVEAVAAVPRKKKLFLRN